MREQVNDGLVILGRSKQTFFSFFLQSNGKNITFLLSWRTGWISHSFFSNVTYFFVFENE